MCVCNERSMFSDFIDITTPSRVTSQGVSPGLRTVILLLALEDGQQRAILSISHVLYILKSPVNLISLAKLNNSGLYWNNRTWNLYYAKETGEIVGYMPK